MPNLPYRKAQARYVIDRLAQRLASPLRRTEAFVPAANVFFIVGHGRSGTQFLAHLLDQARNATVAHEPCAADIYAAQRARLEPAFAEAYMRNFRRFLIQECAERARPGKYGEVNSRLRHFIGPLSRTFPAARLLRLVRDGRDVVRSMMARDRWMIDVIAKRAGQLDIDDPFVGELPQMDDFARACWYWRFDTLRSADQLPAFLRFEDFISDPDYVVEHIVRPLELDLDRDVVTRELATPRNSTQQHAVGDWTGWSAAQRATFERLCGEVMERHGYATR